MCETGFSAHCSGQDEVAASAKSREDPVQAQENPPNRNIGGLRIKIGDIIRSRAPAPRLRWQAG
jgi:hypothetical protein